MLSIKRSLFLAGLFFGTGLTAQDARADLQRLGKAMSGYTNLRQQLSYTVYRDHNGPNILESQNGTYTRQGNNFRLQIGAKVTIQDGLRQLILDPEIQTMTLLPAQPVQAAGPVDLEQWLAGCTHITPLPSQNSRRGWRLDLGPAFGGEVEKVDIWFDPQKWLLLDLILYYNQEQNIGNPQHQVWVKPRLRIAYSQTEIAPQLKAGAFRLDQYVVFHGKKLSPAPVYKFWQVRDLSGQNE